VSGDEFVQRGAAALAVGETGWAAHWPPWHRRPRQERAQ
jgi:hypothetical protein